MTGAKQVEGRRFRGDLRLGGVFQSQREVTFRIENGRRETFDDTSSMFAMDEST